MVWNIIPTKFRISQSIPSSLSDTSCSLCSYPTDSISHLFFTCPIARVVWQQSFWHLDTIALNVTNMTDLLLIILHPHRMLGVPLAETHRFQIFTAVACDYLWFTRNKAHHDGIIPNALIYLLQLKRLLWNTILCGKPNMIKLLKPRRVIPLPISR
jgi:hypothetical protein